MSGERFLRGSAGVLAAAVAASFALSACSGDDADPTDSDRGCAVVQPSEMADIVGQKMTLEDAEEDDGPVCTFASGDGTVLVQTTVTGPVEEGLAGLILTDADALDDLGDEAWYTTTQTPYSARINVQEGGTLLTVDLDAPRLTLKDRKALAVEIATAAADDLPEMEAKEPVGQRGADACERYETTAVAELLGGLPEVTPTVPPGSCSIVITDRNLTVSVTNLVESEATADQLEAIVANVDTKEEAGIEGATGYWLPSTSGGQLDVLLDDRLVQIAVIGDDLAAADAKAIAAGLVPITAAE